jgi:hypothetical protein
MKKVQPNSVSETDNEGKGQGGAKSGRQQVDDRATEGYRTSLHQVAMASGLVWSVFAAMIATNALLVALIGAVITLYPQYAALTTVLPVAGIVICLAWALITMRHFDWVRYWYARAREYEKAAFEKVVTIVRDGEALSRGESVTVNGQSFRMRWGSRLFRVEWLVHLIIVLFLVVHVMLLCKR